MTGDTFITAGPTDLIIGCDGSVEGCPTCDAIRQRLGRPLTDQEIAEASGRPRETIRTTTQEPV